MTNALSITNLSTLSLFKSKPINKTIASPPLAVTLLGLLLAASTSNHTLKQIGGAIALTAGGATVVSISKKGKHQTEIDQIQANHNRREASLKTALDLAMSESETRSEQLIGISAALTNWESEKISIADKIQRLEKQQRQLLHELYESAIAEDTLYTDTNHALAAAQSRITELEAALAAKTNMAAQMLTELETEATNTFNQFNAKITAQNQLIQELRQQIETLKREALIKANTTHTKDRFPSTELNSIPRNQTTSQTKNHSDSPVFGQRKVSQAS